MTLNSSRTAIVLAALAICSACKHDDCLPSGGHSFICGAQRPEDLARIPDTPWLVFSGFTDGAGLKLVDTRTRHASLVHGESAQLAFDAERYGVCPSPPDPALFNTQGLSLRTIGESQHDLYVVNHGGRESIEVFRIDAARDEPQLRWIGCIEMPEATPANSVATYSDGTVLASVLTPPGNLDHRFRARAGRPAVCINGGPGEKRFSSCPARSCPETTASRRRATIASSTSSHSGGMQ